MTAAEAARIRAITDGLGLPGIDFPNIPYAYDHAVESISRLGLGDDWTRGVLHDNAVRLLSL